MHRPDWMRSVRQARAVSLMRRSGILQPVLSGLCRADRDCWQSWPHRWPTGLSVAVRRTAIPTTAGDDAHDLHRLVLGRLSGLFFDACREGVPSPKYIRMFTAQGRDRTSPNMRQFVYFSGISSLKQRLERLRPGQTLAQLGEPGLQGPADGRTGVRSKKSGEREALLPTGPKPPGRRSRSPDHSRVPRPVAHRDRRSGSNTAKYPGTRSADGNETGGAI